jgi:hypothetical protein
VRAIRTTTISILTLGLLAGSAVGVTAQDEATWLIGTSRILNVTDWGVKTEIEGGNGSTELRGQVYEGAIESSDPRFEGTLTGTLNEDAHPVSGSNDPVQAQWGAERIENDGGAWDCTWSGGEIQFGLFQRMKWCVGVDGYEGQAARLLSTQGGGQPTVEWAGVTWYGDLPPMPIAPGQ